MGDWRETYEDFQLKTYADCLGHQKDEGFLVFDIPILAQESEVKVADSLDLR